MKWWDCMSWWFFECWVLSQLFYSPLSLSSRSSLFPLRFLPLWWHHLHVWGVDIFFQQSWFYLVIHPAWHFTCWCFWTVALAKTLESPLNCQEIQPVHPKGDQSWVFIWRTDVEAETPILWPPVVKSWLNGKDPDAGKDWGQEEKRTTEDEMVGWHHRLNGHGFGWTPGVGDGQGSLACCGSWGQQRVGHDWVIELNSSIS